MEPRVIAAYDSGINFLEDDERTKEEGGSWTGGVGQRGVRRPEDFQRRETA